jgi:hypothetical protein
MDLINLNAFLKFGYFLDYENPNIKFDFSGIYKEIFNEYTEFELIQKGSDLWKKAIEKSFNTNQTHLIPLSGGLDSRAILGGLLEFTSTENIYTYTFGTPGTLDYEIGNYIAKKIGTKHTIYPLTKHTYTLDEEIEFSKRINHQTILFHHPPILKTLNRFEGFNVWSGFMGDPIAGSHLLKQPSSTVDEAIKIFIKKNAYTKSIDLLNNCIFSDVLKNSFYVDKNFNKNQITLDEWLDFNYRQLRYVEPHVLLKGFKYKLPFVQKDWFNFMLSVPHKYRLNQNLYIKILINSYPKLFSYKTKQNEGLPLQTNSLNLFTKKGFNYLKKKSGLFVNPGINYIDFNTGIRNRKDLNKLVYENIMDLKHRKIVDWIDIDKIWNNHINKKANHADALIVLASLEIHLKAGKKI